MRTGISGRASGPRDGITPCKKFSRQAVLSRLESLLYEIAGISGPQRRNKIGRSGGQPTVRCRLKAVHGHWRDFRIIQLASVPLGRSNPSFRPA